MKYKICFLVLIFCGTTEYLFSQNNLVANLLRKVIISKLQSVTQPKQKSPQPKQTIILAPNSSMKINGQSLGNGSNEYICQTKPHDTVQDTIELGKDLARQEQWDASKKAFQSILDNDSENFMAHYYLAMLYRKTGDHINAKTEINILLHIQQKQQNAINRLMQQFQKN